MTGQSGFGFAPSLGDQPRASKVARIAKAGLFWMVEAGSGWTPLCSSVDHVDRARMYAARRFPRSLIRLVDVVEVGR